MMDFSILHTINNSFKECKFVDFKTMEHFFTWILFHSFVDLKSKQHTLRKLPITIN